MMKVILTAMMAGVALAQPAPSYTAAGLVNAASGRAGCWSPNTLGVLYGVNFTTGAGAAAGPGAVLPRELNRVSVEVDRVAVPLLYVGPGQVNFWIPGSYRARRVELRVFRAGVTGPALAIDLAPACPELFADAQGFVAASRPDGSIVSPSSPAMPGEILVIYGTGFGPTLHEDGRLDRPARADSLVGSASFAVELDGRAVPGENLWYAGLTPGFPGLYQVNVTLPEWTPGDPAIQVRAGEAASVGTVRLAVKGSGNAGGR